MGAVTAGRAGSGRGRSRGLGRCCWGPSGSRCPSRSAERMAWAQSVFSALRRSLSKEVKKKVGTDRFGNKYYYIPEYKNWRGEGRVGAAVARSERGESESASGTNATCDTQDVTRGEARLLWRRSRSASARGPALPVPGPVPLRRGPVRPVAPARAHTPVLPRGGRPGRSFPLGDWTGTSPRDQSKALGRSGQVTFLLLCPLATRPRGVIEEV